MSNNMTAISWRTDVGVNHVGAYQVSGRPFATGSIDASTAVKVEFPKHSLFTRYFDSNDVLPIPINHGEGNFKFKDINAISKASITKFVYCSDKGESVSTYPVNPNGSDLNIAGISNEAGNVMAIMPHPERAVKWHHIPRYLNHDLSQSRREGSLDFGPWMKLFLSFC